MPTQVRPEAGPAAETRASPRSAGQTDRVTAELRSAILTLDILPGAVLTERGLEKRFNASRTPSRAAIGRLEAEGLVERDGRGWRVTPIDVDDLVKISEFRLIVESAAIRIVSRVASDEQLAVLIRTHGKPEDAGQWSRIDPGTTTSVTAAIEDGEQFHRDLTALTDNRYLQDALDAALMRLARSRWLVVADEGGRTAAHSAHLDVLEAIRGRDPDAAVKIMERHLKESNDTVVEILRLHTAAYRLSGFNLRSRGSGS